MPFSNTILENMRTLAVLAEDELNGYNPQAAYNKDQFLRKGRSVLRAIADHLGLVEYKVDVNKAGIAVSGEVTLIGLSENSKGIYIDISGPPFPASLPEFMYRTVTHMKDWGGSGINQWMTFHALADDPEAACEILAMVYK